MKSLPTVTLLAYDTVEANRSSRVLSHCARMFAFADVVLVTHEKPSIPFSHRVQIVDKGGYSGAMRWEIEGLADSFKTEHSLFVSHDGWILDPAKWSDSWLFYDFIGAPWPAAWGTGSGTRVGNTGFCLRSRRFAQASKHSINFWTDQSADVFTSRTMHRPFTNMGIRYAPVEIAARFSWEHYIEEGDCGPDCSFGFHGWAAGKKKSEFEKTLNSEGEVRLDSRAAIARKPGSPNAEYFAGRVGE